MESTRVGLEEVLKQMQDKLSSSHTQLNNMFKDLFRKHGDIEGQYERYSEQLFALDNMNKMLDTRTKEHADLIT